MEAMTDYFVVYMASSRMQPLPAPLLALTEKLEL